jgi:hypothetical protein
LKKKYINDINSIVAERVGFEPTKLKAQLVFLGGHLRVIYVPV